MIDETPKDDVARCQADSANLPPAGTSRVLIEEVYAELRSLAAQRMRSERVGHTLQATALVSEVCLRLLGGDPSRFRDKAHFLSVAAIAMRRVLVDHARARAASKRQRGQRLTLTVADLGVEQDPHEILALDEALFRLEQGEPEVASVVQLRFFAGLTIDETASVMDISPRQVDRLWTYARAYLFRELGGSRG